MAETQPETTKLAQLELKVPSLVKDADYAELYGVDFSGDTSAFTAAHKTILSKFLKANDDDLQLAQEQLLKTLKWRKEFKPLEAANSEVHDEEFEKLGLITRSPEGLIVTWNLYGAVNNRQELFGRLEEFLRWRVGLMERGIALLDLSDENSQMDQVHDYMDVSFLRMDRETRAASHEVIRMFTDYYPEFLRDKYFVNFSYIMSWVFTMVRAFMSKATSAKFHVLNDGTKLAESLGDWVPTRYGGKGESLLVQSENTFGPTNKAEPKAGEPTAPEVALDVAKESDVKKTSTETPTAIKATPAVVEPAEPVAVPAPAANEEAVAVAVAVAGAEAEPLR